MGSRSPLTTGFTGNPDTEEKHPAGVRAWFGRSCQRSFCGGNQPTAAALYHQIKKAGNVQHDDGDAVSRAKESRSCQSQKRALRWEVSKTREELWPPGRATRRQSGGFPASSLNRRNPSCVYVCHSETSQLWGG
ncbi:hypothetical protein CSUI_009968 (apicoplast) [Cystoisospora suis]|uniref:Uncharacterized protein n=1 Tax=Cystoisospora suis TaxID=483139 RepID=A0A2C6KGH6_9APIC|nr:hypothetical protein CSUI_009968 [Cystoisospora suis]